MNIKFEIQSALKKTQ